MGIYKNALMDNISSKIVVIGGLNRAGKTTFLEALRHMLYGFPKNLREDKTEYYVESDAVCKDLGNFNLRISGLGEPQITSLDYNKAAVPKEIYKNIDSFTYKKLYTITLDELKKASLKEEEEKLQAVLLGAGIKDIVYIPKIMDSFRKEKEKIGGRLGSPNTKMFKIYYDSILEGIESRNKALEGLKEYNEKCVQLEKLEEEIEALGIDIGKIQNEIIIFEALKANFDMYKEMRNIEIEIENYEENYSFEEFNKLPSLERIEILYEEYKNVLTEYKEACSKNSSDKKYYDMLLERQEDIIIFEKQKSGIEQKIQNYLSLKSQFERDRKGILKKMNYLNPDWKENIIEVLNIKCDFIEEDKLLLVIDNINEAEEKQKQILHEIEDINSKKALIKEEFENIASADLSILIKKYLYISLGIIASGVFLFVFNKLLGGSLAIIGITLMSLYFVIKYFSQSNLIMKKRNLELELKSLENKLKSSDSNLEAAKKNIKNLHEELKPYRDRLDAKKEISVNALYQYFKDIQELKERCVNLGYAGKKIQSLYDNIKLDLLKAKDIVNLYKNISLCEEEDILNYSDELFNSMKDIMIQLKEAQNLQDITLKKQTMEHKIIDLFSIEEGTEDVLQVLEEKIHKFKIFNKYLSLKGNKQLVEKQLNEIMKSHRISKAFFELYKEEPFSVNNIFLSYPSKDEIQRRYDECSSELKKLSHNLERLKEKRQELKTDISNLRTSEKLQKAQKQIDEARGQMEDLALKYAYYAGAEYVLEKVQKNFIEKAKDSLLTGASSILDRMTEGEIKSILPSDNLLQSDFKIENKDKEMYKSVDILSRGTVEQLFLSVRINRIKELEPKLPIILDDAFVNFDSIHTKNTLRIVNELVKDHQIFILTCHRELLEIINNVNNEVQYWKLEKGKLKLSDFKSLSDYLS